MDTAILLEENIVRILSCLGPKDVSTCRLVSREWKRLVDDYHLVPLSFYRSCHPLKYSPNPHTAERYYSSTKDWLKGFSSVSDKSLAQLEQFAGHKNFPEMVFSFTAKVLAEARYLRCVPVASFAHFIPPILFGEYFSHPVYSVNFSPCGKFFLTAHHHSTAIICELVDGQWREIASIKHSGYVNNASFSPDGKFLLTASNDGTAKIYGLVDGQWQEIDVIQHFDCVANASFSPDGKYLATTTYRYFNANIFMLAPAMNGDDSIS